MLPRLLELILFGVMPFLVGSVSVSDANPLDDNDPAIQRSIDSGDQGLDETADSDGETAVAPFTIPRR